MNIIKHCYNTVWHCTTSSHKMSSPGSDVQEVLQQHWPTLDTEIFQYICGTSAWHIHSWFRVESQMSHVSGVIFHIMPLEASEIIVCKIYEHECCIWVLYLTIPVVTGGSHLVLASRGNDQVFDSGYKSSKLIIN